MCECIAGSRFGHIHHLFSQAHHGSIVLGSPANHMLGAVMSMPSNINHFQRRTVATSNDEQVRVEYVTTCLKHNANIPIIQKARAMDERSEAMPFGNN